MIGFTLDTGALIAIERRRQRTLGLMRLARREGARVTAPAAVLAEWWRGRTAVRESVLASLTIEVMDEALALIVGETLASVRGSTLVDATVVASAAQRGDVVLTSDVADLHRIAARFPSVRLLGI